MSRAKLQIWVGVAVFYDSTFQGSLGFRLICEVE